MTIRLFGLEIERKTEIIALAAFLLASSSVIYQIYNLFRGADIRVFPPNQIFINSEFYPNSGSYVRFGARLAYVNKAQMGYNDIINKEAIIFSLGGKTYEQVWQTFESFDLKESKLKRNYLSDAHPVSVSAGSSESHETYFAPRSVRCLRNNENCNKWKNYLKWDDFISEIEKVKDLTFTFNSETYDGSNLEVECTIDVDEALIDRLNKSKWAAPSCW